MNEGRVPPQALDAERAVLGSLMLDSEAWVKITHLVNEDSFYDHRNVEIFRAISSLVKRNMPIDLLMVSKALREMGKVEEIGGFLYVTELTSNIGTTTNLEFYARIVQQKFIQRELIKISLGVMEQAYDESSDIEEILNELKVKIGVIDDYSVGQSTGKSQISVIQNTIKEMENDCEEYRKGNSAGITTGFKELNFSTGGWRKTNFILVASRPAIGKTSLALHFAKMASRSGAWVNFYGLEMGAEDLMRIQISGESEVNRTAIRDGHLNDDDWDTINRSLTTLEKHSIIWNDDANMTVNLIKAMTTKNRRKGRCDLVIIDYLQLLTPTDKRANREQQVGEMSRSLKKLALSEKIPIIALAQLNRDADTGKPHLSHLRESGSLEQDADIVIFPWVEDEAYNLTIAKNRRGRVGTIEIAHNEQMTRFSDLPAQIYKHPVKESQNDSQPF